MIPEFECADNGGGVARVWRGVTLLGMGVWDCVVVRQLLISR